MFRNYSSKKKKSKKFKQFQTSHSCSSLSLPPDSPTSEQEDAREKLKFSWVRSESLEYGLFCGQVAAWENTIYFKNGGSDEILEYSCR